MGAVIHTDDLDIFCKDYHLLSDFFDFFCGKSLGEGMTRRVYEFRYDPKYVIKILKANMLDNYNMDNFSEMDIYTNISYHYPQMAKFLAKPVKVSSCGRVLIMEKTEKIFQSQLPEKVPGFLADLHISNWGKIGKRIVCHDYANHNLYNTASTKMVKAKWN